MSKQPVTLSLSNVSKNCGHGKRQFPLLKGLDLTIHQGDCVAIQGVSGSGKTTLLQLCAGILPVSSGQVHCLGQALHGMSDSECADFRGKFLGFVFQHFELLPGMTAFENVQLPAQLLGRPIAKDEAMHWLERVGLADRCDHTPDILSGGEQQRVAIARALALKPRIMFADEPTGQLDKATAAAMMRLMIEEITAQSMTLLLVTHDPVTVAFCQQHYTLDSGMLWCK